MLEQENEEPAAIHTASSDEADNLSEHSSEEEYEPFGGDSSESDMEVDEDEDDLENASLEQRLLDAQTNTELVCIQDWAGGLRRS